MRLTDDEVRKLKRPTSGQVLKWDDLVSGFGVRLTPSATSFVVQWREPDGRKPRESLRPRFPQLLTAVARDMARKRLGEVVALKDKGASVPLRVAIRSWYERKTEIADWRPRYRAKVDALIRNFIEGDETNTRIKLTPSVRAAIAELGNKPLGAVQRTDVMRVADGLKPGAAEQFMAIACSFYNDQYDRGIECNNPFKNRLRVTGGRRIRTRILSDAEFLTLWRAFEKEGDPAFGAFAVLVYTGARRREVTQMRRSELDLKAATWTLPPERRKTGRKDPRPFVINLHPNIVKVLKRQPIVQGNPFVFWGRRDEKPFDFHYALLQRLRALDVPDWRLHDLRRYMRTGLARRGVQQAVAEMCLGHRAKGGLVAVYDSHSYEQEKKGAWLKWGNYLSTLCETGRGR